MTGRPAITREPGEIDEILPGLYQGSVPSLRVLPGRFEMLVLCSREFQFPARVIQGVEIVRVPFDDIETLSHAEMQRIAQAARTVAKAVRSGRRVLVTCAAGLNRSALVVGLAIYLYSGIRGEMLVDLIRARRPGSLFNRGFVSILEHPEDFFWQARGRSSRIKPRAIL